MENLNLNLSIAEINLILNALGSQPYIQVYPLISKIHQQAASQLNTDGNSQTIVVPGQ